MTTRVSQLLPDKDFYLVTGGFHLGGHSERKINHIIRTFQNLGIRKVAPSHCTGQRAIKMFKEEWGNDFINLGCGASLSVAGLRN